VRPSTSTSSPAPQPSSLAHQGTALEGSPAACRQKLRQPAARTPSAAAAKRRECSPAVASLHLARLLPCLQVPVPAWVLAFGGAGICIGLATYGGHLMYSSPKQT
jgi:phosphate/sulfate permease